MRAAKRRLVLLAPVLATACAPDADWRGTVTDSAGVAIVSNPAEALWTEPPAIERELDIGAAEGATEYQFGQITSIAVGEDSSVYVFDTQSRNVRVFDAAGRFVREMGRPGSGPGELGVAGTVLVIPGDTVLVPDITQQRISRFTPEGEPAGSTPLPVTEGISVRWAVTPDGLLVQQTRAFPLDAPTTPPPGDYLFLRDGSGQLRDTLLVLPAGRSVQFQGAGMPRMRLFDSEPVWALASDGRIFSGVNSEFSIGVYSPDGVLERIVRRTVEPRPLTEADREAFIRALREAVGGRGMPPPMVEQLIGNVSFAEFYPAFAGLLGGPEGSLWAQRIQTADDVAAAGAEFDAQDVGAPIWDVFDAGGRYLGALDLPARFTPLIARGDRIWGIWRDDLDVQHVLRLRVTGTWSAPAASS